MRAAENKKLGSHIVTEPRDLNRVQQLFIVDSILNSTCCWSHFLRLSTRVTATRAETICQHKVFYIGTSDEELE